AMRIVARRCHAPTALGPGDKRRDDSCACGADEEPSPRIVNPVPTKPGEGGGIDLSWFRNTSAHRLAQFLQPPINERRPDDDVDEQEKGTYNAVCRNPFAHLRFTHRASGNPEYAEKQECGYQPQE